MTPPPDSRPLKRSYRFIAPIYDLAIARATHAIRAKSLKCLPIETGKILLAGVGTGLDLPHLPAHHRYVGLDLTDAMLRRSLPRANHLTFDAIQGDMHRLPFADASFDAVIAHLILAVVPQPALCLAEISRVLKPGGGGADPRQVPAPTAKGAAAAPAQSASAAYRHPARRGFRGFARRHPGPRPERGQPRSRRRLVPPHPPGPPLNRRQGHRRSRLAAASR